MDNNNQLVLLTT